MTDHAEDHSPARLLRPPAAPSRWGSVTLLGRPAEPVDPAPDVLPTDGSLALQTSTLPRETSGAPATPELRLVTGGTREDEEVQAWAARFAQAVVEVLGGDRPLTQLVRWTSRRVYLELDRRLTILARTQSAGRRMRTVRPQVRSVHVCRPSAGAAEVSVHVRHGLRSRAIAARLELREGRWQCTALQLG